MKHLFHLGIITLCCVAVTSCTKSAKDLVPDLPTAKKEALRQMENKQTSVFMNKSEKSSEILDLINQPHQLKLGSPDNYLAEGETAVFYVVLKKGMLKEAPVNAQFLTIDEYDGATIDKYQLNSYEEADAFGIEVPVELNGQEFMFAIVDFTNQYAGKTLGLRSDITTYYETTSAELNFALIIKPL